MQFGGLLFYSYRVFICTYEDYSNKDCSYQQYIDYKNGYLNDFIYYGGNPKRIDISAYFYDITDNSNEEIKLNFPKYTWNKFSSVLV